MGKSVNDIAEKYQAGRSTVRDYFQRHGIPLRNDGLNRTSYVLRQRTKQYWYKKYWVEGNTVRDLQEEFGINHECVIRIMNERGIPRNTDSKIRWEDKEAGVPRKYRWPEDSTREDPSSTDEPSESLPEDPNPTDYLAKTPLHRDKDRLYQLYWGYGLSAEAIAARCESDGIHVKENLRKLGIPTRDFHDHLRWEPHHGIPPKYEWADDNDEMDHERGLYLSPKGEQNTTRTVGD